MCAMWAGVSFARGEKNKMSRPEKSLQFLLLILLYIYKANFNPGIDLQFAFF